jgi:hypothetical protein
MNMDELSGLSREQFLAKADQDVCKARVSLDRWVSDYHENLQRALAHGLDEIDVLCGLINHIANDDDNLSDRAARGQLISYVAIAVKLLHEQRYGR